MKNELSKRADIIFRRTYCRPKNDDTFETFEEVINRVINHQTWLWERAKKGVLSPTEMSELDDLKKLMLERKVSLAGRTLWLGGTEISRTRESSMKNCAFTEVSTVYDIVDCFWLLLQGSGVGFKPKSGKLTGFKKPIKSIEVRRSERTGKGGCEQNVETFDSDSGEWTIKLGDSAQSWAKAVGKLLVHKYPASRLILDFTELRPAGERLKGYGWISSGDQAVSKSFKAIAEILNNRCGDLLTKIDILDILNWLGTTLSSRRSAEICLIDYGDPEWRSFALAKKEFWLYDNYHRTQSNNSLVFNKKPTRHELSEIFQMMQEAGGSEPGFINAESALKRAKFFSGVNPCVVGDTRILTSDGYFPIKTLIGKNIKVWNGIEWSDTKCFSTGINDLCKVSLSDGTSLTCTLYHKWILKGDIRKEAKDLKIGDKLMKFDMPILEKGCEYEIDAYSQGFYSGDGSTNLNRSYIYRPKYCVISRLIGKVEEEKSNKRRVWKHGKMLDKIFVPIDGNLDYCLDWLAGVFDADGNIMKNPNGDSICLNSNNKEFLSKTRLMLTRLGVQSKICSMKKAGKHSFPDGKGERMDYQCKESFRLLITSWDFKKLVNLGLRFSRLFFSGLDPNRDARRFVTVESVEMLSKKEETFCFTDVLNGSGTFEGIVTGQCAEILLPEKGFCNLSELDVAKFKGDSYGMLKALRLLARANYRQTCVDLNDGILQENWHLNNDFLHLCGVGLTGIVRRPDLTEYDYTSMRRVVTKSAYEMADELDLPYPKNISTIKPSGSLSKSVFDTTEGIHRPLGKYIFNNVAFHVKDPMVDVLKKANYNVFPKPGDLDGVLVTLPIKYQDVEFDIVEGKPINLESAVSQLNRYRMLMRSWCDQNVSCTIYYSPEEVPLIVDWLLANWDDYVGVSFLYRTDPTKTAKDLGYEYLPQEVVTKEVYEEYVSKLKEVDFENTNTDEFEIENQECENGVCPVK